MTTFAIFCTSMALAAPPYTIPIDSPRPVVTRDGIGTLESSASPSHLDVSGGLWLDYSQNVLAVYETSTGNKLGTLVGQRLQAIAQASVGLFGKFTLAAGIPLTYLGGHDLEPGLLPYAGVDTLSGLGDAFLTIHVPVRGDDDDLLRIATAFPVTFPTARTGSFLGEYGIAATPTVFASTDWLSLNSDTSQTLFRPHLRLAYHMRSPAEGYGLVVDDALQYSVGIAATFNAGESNPLRGYVAFHQSHVLRTGCCGPRVSPTEVQAGTSWGLKSQGVQALLGERTELHLTAGVGLGVGTSPMSPGIRTLIGVELRYQAPVDSDQDGLIDENNGCPDRAEDFDGLGDFDGCPERDYDHDGVADNEDSCPTQPETSNGFEDEDGCPDEAAQLQADVHATEEEAAPDASQAVHQTMQANLDTFLGSLRFRKGKKKPLRRSLKVLKQIASFLKDHPEIKKVKIVGHTDNRGRTKRNLILSRQRAEAVRKLLIKKGIEPARIITDGKGDAEPLESNKTRKGRAANRRIVMTIEELEAGASQHQTSQPTATPDNP